MLIRKMVDDIQERRAEKSIRDRKAFLFGAHEFNVASLAYALGTNEPAIPAYGATIILETLRDKKGIYYVQVYYTIIHAANKSRIYIDLQNNRFFMKGQSMTILPAKYNKEEKIWFYFILVTCANLYYIYSYNLCYIFSIF